MLMERQKTTPRDFFLYLGAMVTLYWSAGSLIALFFTIIDAIFKDQLNYYFDPYSSGIRFAIASLIVVFPVSVLLFRSIKGDVMGEPAKLLLPIRRWFFAFTVFLTSAALIGDIIALLNTFLGGEITTRFVLKVASVIVVAGLVFWYCFLELRTKPEAPAVVRKEFLWGGADPRACGCHHRICSHGFAVRNPRSAFRRTTRAGPRLHTVGDRQLLGAEIEAARNARGA